MRWIIVYLLLDIHRAHLELEVGLGQKQETKVLQNLKTLDLLNLLCRRAHINRMMINSSICLRARSCMSWRPVITQNSNPTFHDMAFVLSFKRPHNFLVTTLNYSGNWPSTFNRRREKSLCKVQRDHVLCFNTFEPLPHVKSSLDHSAHIANSKTHPLQQISRHLIHIWAGENVKEFFPSF